MSERPSVALLGTGTMGAGMARNLAAAGIPLRVWNPTRSKAEPLTEAGATVADSVTEAVRGADVVITMLYDADSVESALTEGRDGLTKGTVLLQQSTVGVEGAERLATLADELGLVYVDAPVLGTKKTVRWSSSRRGRRTSRRHSHRCWTRSGLGLSGSARPARAPG